MTPPPVETIRWTTDERALWRVVLERWDALERALRELAARVEAAEAQQQTAQVLAADGARRKAAQAKRRRMFHAEQQARR